MKRYDYLKMQHRCVRCKTRDAYTLNGHPFCYECTQHNTEKSREYREKNREKVKEYMSERRDRLREQGLCYQCGKRSVEEGHARCAICRHKDNKNHQRKRNFYPAPELCSRCHKKPCFGEFKVCEDCYNDGLNGSAAADAVRDNRDHPWRKVFREK